MYRRTRLSDHVAYHRLNGNIVRPGIARSMFLGMPQAIPRIGIGLDRRIIVHLIWMYSLVSMGREFQAKVREAQRSDLGVGI